jgi:hypothetical protein
MPDPRELKIGDRIRFLSLPDEWNDPKCCVFEESVAFMRTLISRRRACRVAEIHADGYPWINARVRSIDEVLEYHSWGIYEASGWRLVRKRFKE